MNDLIKENDLVVLYFASYTCGVCVSLLPKLTRMLEKYPNIVTAKVQVEEAPELSATCKIFSAPAILLFIQGEETLREAGVWSLRELEPKIERYYNLFLDIKADGN